MKLYKPTGINVFELSGLWMSEFIRTYKKANSISDKVMCFIAKILGAHVVTPLGRIVLLKSDYKSMEKQYDVDQK